MEEKYYLDACIWRDYFENREDRFRPLGEWAFRLVNYHYINEMASCFKDVSNETSPQALLPEAPSVVFPLWKYDI